jgi:hypothetical protein
MSSVPLSQLAFARSGDKGDSTNVGVVAKSQAAYDLLVRELTAERVQRHFAGISKGKVERFEVPNLRALNFLLHQSLEGGASSSLRTDAQGKIHGPAILFLKIDVPDGFALPNP